MTIGEMSIWIQDRVRVATRSTLPIYVGQFEDMWLEEFGTLENVPTEVNVMIQRKYNEFKAASSL